MHPEELSAIREEAKKYEESWRDTFSRQLKARIIDERDIAFLALYDAAADSALTYLVQSDQAPTMKMGDPWDSNAPTFVVQDDPDFRAAESDRAYRALAILEESTAIQMYERHTGIMRKAIGWQNEQVDRRNKGLEHLL